jgi:hypothetical protein
MKNKMSEDVADHTAAAASIMTEMLGKTFHKIA